MKLEKLLYSKCPHCKKHGIPALKTARFHQPTLTCKKCGSKYKANGILSMLLIISVPFLLFLFSNIIFDINFNDIFIVIIMAMSIFIIEYFLPIESVDE